ncbi:Oxygen tolerance [Methylomagnum ishizawai]|uniref:Oxygen tolerance n=1 Tax=Methylomagnum ishizawai TaxID=1760988 RepID=A0A1Y6D2B4_9GAMM|nr:BatD family protein [Methylomagnum ishizawai]SMF96751.1 Oxygen tolerance [Methylomagnum ishizawai]
MVNPMAKGKRATVRRWLWLGLLLALYAGLGLAARIEVSLDRNPVPLGESFTLIFSADASPDDDPDFSTLEQDFEVLGQSQSNQYSLNNGHASHRIEWQVSVMAKHAGNLAIPPIAFGKDRSEPFSVTVVPGPAKRRNNGDGEVFMEVEAEPKNPYVQAQVIYSVRVLSRIAFGDARLSTPEAADTLVERLGDGQNPSSIVIRNGVQYKMTEIRYALFPQKSGPLRIEPMQLEMQVAGGARSLFNAFLNPQTRTQRIVSEALTLEVRPVPAEFKGKHWLPARYLELEDSWAKNPPKTTAGDPLTRTLTLKAQGATVGLLPEINTTATALPDAIKQYPDQPIQNEEKPTSGLIGMRQEKTAMMATNPGTYTIPALEIPWWNTLANRMETARIPERTLTVQATAATRQIPETPTLIAEASKPPKTTETPNAALPTTVSQTNGPWFWLVLLFGFGWISTGLAWYLSKRSNHKSSIPVNSDSETSVHKLVLAIEHACKASDAVAARKALSNWVNNQRFRSEAQPYGSRLAKEIKLLDQCLYGRRQSAWEGQGLWQSFRDHIENMARGTPSKPALESLYLSSNSPSNIQCKEPRY